VEHEKGAAIHRPVHRFLTDEDIAELEVAEAPDILVVVAGNEGDGRARTRLGDNLPEHVAVELRPVRRPLEPPEIDDVADQIEIVTIVGIQEVEERLGLTVSRAQMGIGEPYRPIVGRGHEASLGPMRPSGGGRHRLQSSRVMCMEADLSPHRQCPAGDLHPLR
jgi:hypothetical protein